MIPRALSEIATAVGGTADGEDPTISAVVTDSRVAVPGALFVALAGEHADGHDFVADAFARGASAALVERPANAGGPEVEVADTVRALMDLGADERNRMKLTVLGITGANGKTSTKDLAASILATGFPTHASPGSFNNEIGLPVTLLGAPANTEVLVAEMGARREGDVLELCRVARPRIVVVTNVGVAHMEIFGSMDAIVRSSAEPVEWLDEDGIAILNADDPVARGFAERCRGRAVTFGLASAADVRASDVILDDDGRASLSLSAGDVRERIELPIAGEHMVSNALAAAACALELGLSGAEIAAALKGASVSPWRMETFTTADGIRVVNDAYNANPESMAAGLKAARWMAREGRLAAVLGHMAELGPVAFEEHERLGELVVRIGVERLITVGEPAEAIARAALREGQLPQDLASYAAAADAVRDVRAWMRAGDVVLVKGSRIVGLEVVAEALR